ncbi:trigger factor [Chloroflexus sp.]|uniref:trigger factor n=1 Tax=Chloroflexus sp. TaxID=1904827 RepID=UPI002ADE5817|nr:trigger factor [Chloroflexus sp.]
MKVITEKLPKSMIALQIEIDRDQFERSLNQAARRLSQKFPIQGFRPGKAPRFIIERTFGREALIEEATEELINTGYRKAIKQENIEVVGPPNLDKIHSIEPFVFTVHVPVPPTVTLPDYRSIHVPLAVEPITDEMVEAALEQIREKHLTLQELDEPRPAQQGDQVQVRLKTVVEGEEEEATEEQTEEVADDSEAKAETEAETDQTDDEEKGDEVESEGSEETLPLEPNRLIPELYEGLIGTSVGEKKTIVAVLPDDHHEESLRGKKITFHVEILDIKRRIVPAWEELPALESFNGTLEEFRAHVRENLANQERKRAEQEQLNAYIEQLVEQTTFDIPDVMIRDVAHSMLHEQEQQFARYGISLDQVLQYRGVTHDQAVDELIPEAEKQVKVTLALSEVIKQEGITVDEDEIEAEIQTILESYDEKQRPQVESSLRGQLRSSVANVVLDKKLRALLNAIASGNSTDTSDSSPAAPDGEGATDVTNSDEPVSRSSHEA